MESKEEFDAIYLANVQSETACINECIASGKTYENRFYIDELMTSQITESPESLKVLQAAVMHFLLGNDASAALMMKQLVLDAKAQFVREAATLKTNEQMGLVS